jgi:hypothetical protein
VTRGGPERPVTTHPSEAERDVYGIAAHFWTAVAVGVGLLVVGLIAVVLGTGWLLERLLAAGGVVKAVILLGWFFLTLSWFQAPWGSGGWYVAPPIGPFATKKECEEAAVWVLKTAAPRPVIPSRCYEDGR